MIQDNELFYTRNSSGGEALAEITVSGGAAGNTGSAVCSRVLDFGQGGDAMGGNELVAYTCLRGGTITSGGTATVATKFETSPDSSSWTELFTQKNSNVTVLNGGVILPRMKVLDGWQRYNRATVSITVPANVNVTSALADVFLAKEQ